MYKEGKYIRGGELSDRSKKKVQGSGGDKKKCDKIGYTERIKSSQITLPRNLPRASRRTEPAAGGGELSSRRQATGDKKRSLSTH